MCIGKTSDLPRWLSVVIVHSAGLFAISLSCPSEVWADFFVQTFDDSRLYSVNPDTGSATLIGPMGVNQMTDLAMRADGQLFASNYNNLYSVNTLTGAATPIGPFGTTSSMVGLDFGPGGLLYGVEQIGGRVLSIDPNTGSATALFGTPFNYVGDISHFSGNVFYAAGYPLVGSHLIEINIGAATSIDRGLIAAAETIPGLDFEIGGRLVAFAQSGNAYDIPNFSSSGTGVLLSNNGVAMAGATTQSVPEPATFFTFFGCAVALYSYFRKGRMLATARANTY